MHYVACFYSQLLKQKVVTPAKGLPPVFPVVLYNGAKRWSAKTDIFDMICPVPPAFLQVYQPHLRYYLIDEGRYTEAELTQIQTPLSGVFGIESAGESWEALQRAVDRIVAIIRTDPNKERIDPLITRWLKRRLHWLGAEVNLDQLNSLVEDNAMLAENLENLVKKERLVARQEGHFEGRQEGRQEGRLEGRLEGEKRVLRKLISLKFGDLPDWAEQRLEQGTPEQLEQWSATILVANSLDELFKH